MIGGMVNGHPAADRTGENLDFTGALRPRRAPRVSLEAEVTLRRSGQISYRVHAYDISLQGCCLEFVERPDLDELLWVRFDGIEALDAVVCWTLPPLVGLRFQRPIHPAVFDLLVSRLKAA